MLGTKHAVWLGTQVIRNDALRPSPARQMVCYLLINFKAAKCSGSQLQSVNRAVQT